MMMTLTKSVSETTQNQRNVALRATELICDFGLGHLAGQGSDLDGLISCQKLAEAGDESGVDGVLLVGSVVDPFKISGEAIRLHPIDVVDHREVVGVRNESDCYEPVNVNRLGFAVSVEVDLRVSDSIDATFKNLSVASLWAIWPQAKSVKTSNSSDVADFVKSFETEDSSPFLNHHQMGPFARSAHSIVLSSTTQGGHQCRFH